MKTVWKYEITGRQISLAMPEGAQILTIASQAGKPQLWALVNPDPPAFVTRRFILFGTGNPIADDIAERYIGTFTEFDGALVWHLFERAWKTGDGTGQDASPPLP